jgi:hypothetical protein
LPEYLVPAVFVELAGLPLSVNGKVDRAALPAPDGVRPDPGGFVAPQTPTEQRLAGIWADVLGLDQIGASDSFFELGGHPLLATRVVSRTRAAFGTALALAALFDHPTVRGLARVIDRSEAGGVLAAPIVPVDRDRMLPLSYADEGAAVSGAWLSQGLARWTNP